jgi:hypothetical protein
MAPKRKPLAAAKKESDGDSSFLDDGSGSDVGSKRPATKKTKKTQAGYSRLFVVGPLHYSPKSLVWLIVYFFHPKCNRDDCDTPATACGL